MKSCPQCHVTYPSTFSLCPHDGATLAESSAWSDGMLVRGKYRILAQIGRGGMAIVYKAMHERFNELRALKVMNPELAADQSFVKRFMHEAVITRRLQHPNAVRVEDIDEAEDGRPFIVMEFIEGRSLKEVIAQKEPLAVARVCSIVKQIASALDAAHQLGMIHRDIKLANIVLVGGGTPEPRPQTDGATQVFNASAPSSDHSPRPIADERARYNNSELAKVLDFGIAKIKEAHIEDTRLRLSTVTDSGMVVGTPAYMSPEQAMGKRGEELDGRADLYSLGVVMYQMLAGELPLKADSGLQMLMAQINTIPPHIRNRRSDVPGTIAALVMQCLEKDRNRRPASAHSVIEQIEYWEEEPARVKAEQARAEREKAEREKVERERREMAEAKARVKAEQERAERERSAQRGPTVAAKSECHSEEVAAATDEESRLGLSSAPEQSEIPRGVYPERSRRARNDSSNPVAKPAPQPVAEAPRPSHVPVRPSSRSWSRSDSWFVIAAVLVAIIALWYFWPVAPKQTDRQSSPTQRTEQNSAAPVTLPSASPASTDQGSEASPVGTSSPAQTSSVTPPTAQNPSRSAVRRKVRPSDQTANNNVDNSPPVEAAKKAAIERQAQAWAALGDVDADTSYDAAIADYQKALALDPQLPGLKEKLDHAMKAKAAIDSLNH